jgi:hypothetical protein
MVLSRYATIEPSMRQARIILSAIACSNFWREENISEVRACETHHPRVGGVVSARMVEHRIEPCARWYHILS